MVNQIYRVAKNMYTIYSKVYNYRYKVFSQFIKNIFQFDSGGNIFFLLAETSMNILLQKEVSIDSKQKLKNTFIQSNIS